ncbi:phage antirepressor N-terminal domain-containing protein [Bifidobacterium pseudolongum]|nr:phage antirepressor N-terminal domain-containing protein [Bifidobacterium pseudolongum]
MTSTTLTQIPFHNQTILAQQQEDGQVFVPLKPVCENLGIAYNGQYERLQRQEWATIRMTRTVGADGKTYNMTPAFGNTDPISYNFRSASMHALTDGHIMVHRKGRGRDARNPSKALADHADDEDSLNNKSLSSPGRHRGRLVNKFNRHQCSLGVSSTSIVQSSAAAMASRSEVVKSTAPFIFRKNAGLLIPAFSYKSFAVIPSSFFLRVMDSISACCVVVDIPPNVQVSDKRHAERFTYGF